MSQQNGNQSAGPNAGAAPSPGPAQALCKNRDFDLLLLDADETLFDFTRSAREALRATMESAGIVCSDEEVDRYNAINQSYWQLFERGEVPKEDLQHRRFEDFLRELRERRGAETLWSAAEINAGYLDALSAKPYLIDGAEALCKALAPRYRMSIVTNGVSSMQRARIGRSAVAGCFEHLFVSEELGAQKPDPAFFEAVFRFYPEVPRSRVLVIGDSLTADIAGGAAAGLATCWFLRPGRRADAAKGAAPDHTAHGYAELRALLLPPCGERTAPEKASGKAATAWNPS